MSGTNDGASGSGYVKKEMIIFNKARKIPEKENAVNPEEFGEYGDTQRDYVFKWLGRLRGPGNNEESNFPVRPPEVPKYDFVQLRKQLNADLFIKAAEEKEIRLQREKAAREAWDKKRKVEEAEAREREAKRKAEIQANIERNDLAQGGRRKRHRRKNNRVVDTIDLTESTESMDWLNDVEPGPSFYTDLLMSTGLVEIENKSGYIFPTPRAPEGPPPFDRTNFPPLK